MMTMSSTLVETVSIDYEDFNESFLTCGTCLCMYDGGEHTPKLLPCSHTVCLNCLQRIVATSARDTGQFRCPNCRELITIPSGGVQALPASFLVNQLLDLMARQRREVIPKCSTHHDQELLFCETCDTVFCTLCTGGTHSPTVPNDTMGGPTSTKNMTATVDHTVIPFSIAIKRMSEILIYKANECRAKLDEASEIVNDEIHRLDHNADSAFETVNSIFQSVIDVVEKRRQEVLAKIRDCRDEKKKVLDDQLQLIQQERGKVDSDVKNMQHQVEVRNITKKISDLNCKLDTVSHLSEPRENSYIEYAVSDEMTEGKSTLVKEIKASLDGIGRIKTSKTFPSLCRCTMETAISNLSLTARVTTMDYHGSLQSKGGDPVESVVLDDKGDMVHNTILDNEDGTYDITFTPRKAGTYCLKVLIFGRPIKDCPLFFDVTDHNPPVVSFGSNGSKDKEFVQPCNVAFDDKTGIVFVLDPGNSRIKRLTSNLDFDGHITNDCLNGRSATGVCMGPNHDTLIVINWRTKRVTEINARNGETVNSFTYDDFNEPIGVALDRKNHRILVVDSPLRKLLVFDQESGELVNTIRHPPETDEAGKNVVKNISAVCVSPIDGNYIVAFDLSIYVFSPDGDFLRKMATPNIDKSASGAKGNKRRIGGLTCDRHGFLLATLTHSRQSFILVFSYENGELYSSIDSHGSRLRQPRGLAAMNDGHLVVADFVLECVRKYRYF